jgi:3-hydroxyisobutyrate dehydrogenase-like beta-hydroxyacid dehydrogenase
MKTRRFFLRFAVALASVTAMQSFAEVRYVRTTVQTMLHRDYGTHFYLSPTVTQAVKDAGLACPQSANLNAPVVLFSAVNYKTYRDTMMLAHSLKVDVNMIFDTTTPCLFGVFPVVNFIDLVGNPVY